MDSREPRTAAGQALVAKASPFSGGKWESVSLRAGAWRETVAAIEDEAARAASEQVAALRTGLADLHRLWNEYGHRPGDHFDECRFCALIHGSGFAYPASPAPSPAREALDVAADLRWTAMWPGSRDKGKAAAIRAMKSEDRRNE